MVIYDLLLKLYLIFWSAGSLGKVVYLHNAQSFCQTSITSSNILLNQINRIRLVAVILDNNFFITHILIVKTSF